MPQAGGAAQPEADRPTRDGPMIGGESATLDRADELAPGVVGHVEGRVDPADRPGRLGQPALETEQGVDAGGPVRRRQGPTDGPGEVPPLQDSRTLVARPGKEVIRLLGPALGQGPSGTPQGPAPRVLEVLELVLEGLPPAGGEGRPEDERPGVGRHGSRGQEGDEGKLGLAAGQEGLPEAP